MFHSSMRQGKKVLLILKDGRRVFGKFKESRKNAVLLYGGSKFLKLQIDKLIVYKTNHGGEVLDEGGPDVV